MLGFDHFHRMRKIRTMKRRKEWEYEEGINSLDDLKRVLNNIINSPNKKEEDEIELLRKTKEQMEKNNGRMS